MKTTAPKNRKGRRIGIILATFSLLILFLGVPNWLEFQDRIQVSEVRKAFRTLASALENYAVDHEAYPTALAPQLTTPIAYLTELPRDPFVADGRFTYFAPPDGGWVVISPGPDGEIEIDPAAEYGADVFQPCFTIMGKVYDEGDWYEHQYTDNQPVSHGVGDLFACRRMVVTRPRTPLLDPLPKRAQSEYNSAVMAFRAAIAQGDRQETLKHLNMGAKCDARHASWDSDHLPMGPYPLELAVCYRQKEIVKLLLERGALPHKVWHHPRGSLLGLAIESGQREVAEMLAPHAGALPLEQQRRAFLRAARAGYAKVIAEMLKVGADADWQSEGGKNTALYFATAKGHQEVVEILLKHGASPLK